MKKGSFQQFLIVIQRTEYYFTLPMIDYTTYDDTELIRAIALEETDTQAFTIFYNRHLARVYKKMLVFLKNSGDAEEAVQEVFIRIWKRKEFLLEVNNIEAYFNTICRNMVYDRFRKARTNQHLLDKLQAAAIEHPELAPDADAQLLVKQEWELLQKALDTLPPQRRRVFELCKVEGKSYDEVCAEMGISLPTAKEHVMRAKRDIRDYLSEQGEIAVSLLILLDMISE
ncbi:MAG: RNA polymerase sigma factor [Sediminibacterium sp.]|nr:RNA polymerase sigma factor [Sediminibacterium sp.]